MFFQEMYPHELSVTTYNVNTYMSSLANEIGTNVCVDLHLQEYTIIHKIWVIVQIRICYHPKGYELGGRKIKMSRHEEATSYHFL